MEQWLGDQYDVQRMDSLSGLTSKCIAIIIIIMIIIIGTCNIGVRIRIVYW